MRHDGISVHTIRGAIYHHVKRNLETLRGECRVIEVGSRKFRGAQWWADFRQLTLDMGHRYKGTDFMAGPNVDLVVDLSEPNGPVELLRKTNRLADLVICTEVLEHVWNPGALLRGMFQILKPNGLLVLTTLFAFPIHNHPEDFWRFTPVCLERLFLASGLTEVDVKTNGETLFSIDNHGAGLVRRTAPVQLLATARKVTP